MVPVTFSTCGLPGALSLMSIVPVTVPGAVFLNPTLRVQEFPAVRPPSQVFDSLKGALAVMPVMLRSALP